MSDLRTPLRVVVAAVIASCMGAAQADAIGEASQGLQSWAGTVRMTSRAWLRHAVPSAYASRTLEAASQSLKAEALSLASHGREGSGAAALRARIDAVDDLVGDLIAATRGNGATDIGPLLDRLDALVPPPGQPR